MQGKGIVRFFLIALTVVCVYQFLLVIPTNRVEHKAKLYADEMSAKDSKGSWRTYYSSYLDSISSEVVFSIPLIKKFTYTDLKKAQLGLGLDLKGGMSVLLQVDLSDFLKSLAGNTNDPNFKKALERTAELQKTQQADYITIFAQAWKEVGEGKPLASLFGRSETLKGKINFESPDADVLREVRTLADQAVNETYKRLKQRIDKLGVVQPNVNLDESRDLILVELPGIDNPERARRMLQKAAKLEFWDTYRLGDGNIAESLVAADKKLAKLAVGDTTQVEEPAAIKDTSYVYPAKPDGTPDSTQQPEMRITERPADTSKVKPGPLFTMLGVTGQPESEIIGFADKNKLEAIKNMLEKPEIQPLFPNDLIFRWSQKPIIDEKNPGLNGKYQLYALKKFKGQDQPRIDGSVVTDARDDIDPRSNEISVTLRMNPDGAREWADMTRKAYEGGGRSIAIVLDDEVVSAPGVRNGAIEGGVSSISGGFNVEEAKDLASILEVGKLPAATRIVQESQVGPSLGADNINKSLITMVLSVLLLCVFMIGYYAKGGIISVIALLANIFFILGSLASFGTVLTLPGIAGIVLTLATAVDANVIIYERIREELRGGLETAKAIPIGFSRSLPAIIDANVTTLLTAVVLVIFGLGPIKGFGTVLIVGIFSSMLTAVLMGRMITDEWLKRDSNLTYSFPWSANWLVGANFDWIGNRRWAYLFSGAIIAIGIGAFFMRGFELGVDFKGGYSFNVQFDQPVTLEQLRPVLTEAFGGNPIVKKVSTENTYNITTSYLIEEQGPEVMKKVQMKLYEGLTKVGVTSKYEDFINTEYDKGAHIASSNQVSATVADDIRESSWKAGLWSLVLIFVYLLLRFNSWQFSLGAVLALFHDVLITLTFFTLLHGIVPFSLEIDQGIIAMILTVIGFSVNDTVIVYDRIREFINTYSGRPKEEVFNMAINTTLSRTLITSGTIFIVVFLLFAFGGGAIKGFAFGMFIGILFGTYSSVFVASAFVVDLTREKVLGGGKSVTAKSAGAAATASESDKKGRSTKRANV